MEDISLDSLTTKNEPFYVMLRTKGWIRKKIRQSISHEHLYPIESIG